LISILIVTVFFICYISVFLYAFCNRFQAGTYDASLE